MNAHNPQRARVRRTTLLGVTYEGRPMMGSLAASLHRLECQGEREEAQALLDSHNQIRRAFGEPPVDLADDFTTVPMEGLETVPAGKLLDEERAIDRVVTRTVRRAA